MFNKEYIANVMDTYGVNQLLVDREGQVFAPNSSGPHTLIPGLVFDTDTADGTVAAQIIADAMGADGTEE